MNSEFYIFAGGGTGGHLYPGLAVAEELLRLKGEARVVFACSNRSIDRRILDPLPHAIVPQPVRPLPHRPSQIAPFLQAWMRSKTQAKEMLHDLKPAAVLGLGGFAAGPVVRQAAKLGIRTGLLNPDAVVGKANRYLARRVDAIFTQFVATAEHLPAGLRAKVRCVGCPVRERFFNVNRDAAIAHFDLCPGLKTLLVLGGSQGSESISGALAALARSGGFSALAETWQVLHVVGPGRDDPTRGAFESAGVHLTTLEYCDRMDLACAAADVVLARGGAATIAELTATATPAVIMPYPHHADRQQWLNAACMAEAGAAVVCDDLQDTGANAEALRETLLPVLQDSCRLAAMREGAAGLAKCQAARDVARWLLR